MLSCRHAMVQGWLRLMGLGLIICIVKHASLGSISCNDLSLAVTKSAQYFAAMAARPDVPAYVSFATDHGPFPSPQRE